MATYAFNPLSAKNAHVRFGFNDGGATNPGYIFTAKRWTVTPRVDALDVTNFEGLGFADWLGGIKECEIVIEADWDSVSDMFLDPPGTLPTAGINSGGYGTGFGDTILAGQILTNVYLFLATGDGTLATSAGVITTPFWAFPKVLVVETPMVTTVRETVGITVTCKSKGPFAEPHRTSAVPSDNYS